MCLCRRNLWRENLVIFNICVRVWRNGNGWPRQIRLNTKGIHRGVALVLLPQPHGPHLNRHRDRILLLTRHRAVWTPRPSGECVACETLPSSVRPSIRPYKTPYRRPWTDEVARQTYKRNYADYRQSPRGLEPHDDDEEKYHKGVSLLVLFDFTRRR